MSVTHICALLTLLAAGCAAVETTESPCPTLDRAACRAEPSCAYVDQAAADEPIQTGCYAECVFSECASGTQCDTISLKQNPQIDVVASVTVCR
jgi:hypothetical protein